MKTKSQSRPPGELGARRKWCRRCLLTAAMLVSGGAAAADSTNSPAAKPVEPLTPSQAFEGGSDTCNNWIEFGVGDLMTGGNRAQAQQSNHARQGVFGGISDFHLQEDVAKKTTFTADGHALLDQNDYKLTLGLSRDNFGYLKVSAQDFRTWYDGAGGYYPPTRTPYNLSNDSLSLDRGEYSVEAGLTPADLPQIVFKYTHSFRDGDKSSTIWAPVHPDGTATVSGVYPSIYNIDEKVDSYSLDVTHHIKTTDFGVGVRYQTARLNDSRRETFWAGEPALQNVTDKQDTSYDLLNVHSFSETWLEKNLFLSVGYNFANVNDNFSASRIYGDDFDVVYSPSPLNGLGYTSLNGGAHEQEHAANVNLMATVFKNLTFVPSIRVQQNSWDANSSGVGTLGADTEPFTGSSDGETLDVRQCLDVRYTGVTNWVYYGGLQLTEGSGNLDQYGGLTQVNGFGPPTVQSRSDNSTWFQKYSLGVRWYPYRRTSIDVGGYYKDNQYDYNFPQDSTLNDATSPDRYPGYLVLQSFQTYDGSVRLSIRPTQKITLVSRYEYQLSSINTSPDAISGLSETESSKMTTHIIGQNVSWTPWSRLCFQAGLNFVISGTHTPASSYTQAVLDSQNNYWTVTFNSCVVLDDKTDLNLSYLYYQASDFNPNASAGLPLGAGSDEHSVSAAITRRLNPHLRVSLRCAYSACNDWASGGNNNFNSEMVYSSLQYQF